VHKISSRLSTQDHDVLLLKVVPGVVSLRSVCANEALHPLTRWLTSYRRVEDNDELFSGPPRCFFVLLDAYALFLAFLSCR
jgi:hypothetical protein